ncbi:hypothetical protein GP486_007890 [Trichoglossum hirsutum]|uniref:Uncharacterized protein n=1 Tax=Trichoglossum hirsutum TaxID=265104 RepID=A0A9P8IAZ9_9PEZI|nr:hypothetical protein GP486_007890 [Trichoglossum hirsutum]
MTSQASRPNITTSESLTVPFSSRRTSIELVEYIDMTQDNILLESFAPHDSQALISTSDSQENLLGYVILSLEAKASGNKSGKYLTEDELKLHLLMLRPVQDLLEQQKIKIMQLKVDIEGLQARILQVSKSKLDKDVRGKRKRVVGE